jgi:hypothetical protein
MAKAPRKLHNDTTDLADVHIQPERFTWGKVVRFHNIGRYDFVEYYGRAYKDSRATGDLEDTTSFHIYVDGKSTSSGATSLEGAMITAIALGKLEVNAARWMAISASKLLEI